LKMPYEMPGNIFREGFKFTAKFLYLAFTKNTLPAIISFQQRFIGMELGDAHQLHMRRYVFSYFFYVRLNGHF